MSELILALDFGGTKLTAAVTTVGDVRSGTGTWRDRRQRASPAGADAKYDLETMLKLAQRILSGASPFAVGVSFGGPVDFESGVVRLSHHVPGWENVPLKAWLEQEYGVPVCIDNDANVAALGEHRFGAGRGCDHLMYITVSTGVGGGWILNGSPWRGHEGLAGEIGHTVVDPAGPVCLCGKRGCVERLASGPFMAMDLRDAWLSERSEAEALIPQEAVTGKHVAEAAEAGDEAAMGILDRGAWALGVGIGHAANLINPQRFVLGGGVTKSGQRWWEMVRQTARQIALPEVSFDIVPAVLEDDAPLWGGVALALEAITSA